MGATPPRKHELSFPHSRLSGLFTLCSGQRVCVGQNVVGSGSVFRRPMQQRRECMMRPAQLPALSIYSKGTPSHASVEEG